MATFLATAALALLAKGAHAQEKQPVNYAKAGTDWINGVNNNVPIPGNVCNGQNQSPLNIVDGATGNGARYNAVYDPSLAPLQLSYSAQSYYTALVNDHTLQINFNSTTVANDGIFVPIAGFIPAVQMHIHSPSEHLLNGASWELELHIVHYTPGLAKVAVIGVVFAVSPDPTYTNPFIQGLLGAVPGAATVANQVILPGQTGYNAYSLQSNFSVTPSTGDAVFNLGVDIFAGIDTTKYYRYSGSLTTPPCLEGLYWHWLPTPLMISQAQINQITTYLAIVQEGNSRGADNRPVQPQNARTVSRSFRVNTKKKGGKGARGLLNV